MLLQVAQALQCTLADLVVGEPVAQSPERGAILSLLAQRDETALRRARLALSELLGARPPSRAGRVALI